MASTMDQQQADLLGALTEFGLEVTVNDITSGFDTLGLSKLAANQASAILGPNAHHHELHLEYPAMGILPAGVTPYLCEPRHIRIRESPRMNTFSHDINNLAFFTRFHTQTSVTNAVLPSPQAATNIISAVNRLASSPGISNLEVATYMEADEIYYRARLQTTWLTGSTRTVETHEFTYCGIEWDLHVALADEEWSILLKDLMERASDRSYLHVRERLRAQSAPLAFSHDKLCSSLWDSDSFPSPNRVLINTITWNDDGLAAYLPCDCIMYRFELTAQYLTNALTMQDAVDFACPCCKKPVLEDENREDALLMLQQHEDRAERRLANINEQCWAALPTTFLKTNHSFEVTHGDLLAAIDAALPTFELPESVLPAEMSFTVFSETATVTNHLTALLTANEEMKINVMPHAMPDLLVELANSALREEAGCDTYDLKRVLPTAYADFLLRWFTRAVVIVAYRNYKIEDAVTDELMKILMGKH